MASTLPIPNSLCRSERLFVRRATNAVDLALSPRAPTPPRAFNATNACVCLARVPFCSRRLTDVCRCPLIRVPPRRGRRGSPPGVLPSQWLVPSVSRCRLSERGFLLVSVEPQPSSPVGSHACPRSTAVTHLRQRRLRAEPLDPFKKPRQPMLRPVNCPRPMGLPFRRPI
jgi:hypothetical protein